MFKPALAATAFLLLAACATAEPAAPADEEPASPVEDNSYAARIERAANARLEGEEGLPAGLEIFIESVEEAGPNLLYKAQILTAKNRRREQDYILYGQCPADQIDACAEQVASAAKMLKE